MSAKQYIAKAYSEENRLKNETLFHAASGRLGIRGCFEEGAPEGTPSVRGAYLNGFCETEPVRYNEKLCGFPEEKQVIVNLPDAQTIRLRAEGEELVCWRGEELVQTLDMENGVTVRSFRFKTPSGTLRLCFTRLVSFPAQELFAVECRIESADFEGSVTVTSELNADVRNYTDTSDPRVASGSGLMLRTCALGACGDCMTAEVETIRSGRRALCAVVHDVGGRFSPAEGGKLAFRTEFRLRRGDTAVFHKYCLYRELTEGSDRSSALLCLKKYAAIGFDSLKEEQRRFLDGFWSHAGVTVGGDGELQNEVDLCLYSMLSSAGRDGRSNVAAKGLSGEGYEGHYFWDSEIYVFPFFLMTEPETARALLQYRFGHLDDARAHARRMGHPVGALYPWRTITGSECSSHYPSGSAQYHINGDIAKAFSSYWDATGDESFLPQSCELLCETARLWLDAGHWLDGSFRIDCVTGPDEYTCLVNNNYYTNSCAAANMLDAVRLCRELEKRGGLDALKEKLGLTEEELREMQRAGENMLYPYDEALGIIAQDDSFLHKKRWELRDIPKENFPLLMHYHPLAINRCQILKQADSVLANHLYHEETPLIMRRSYDYYEQITTHDSSLSNCIYSVMAARLGDVKKAGEYFEKCVGTDTRDNNGNTRDGLHIANMGGVYKALTAGFGGVRVDSRGLTLFPLLPEGLSSLEFPVAFRGSRIRVKVVPGGCRLRVIEGESVKLTVYGRELTVGAEELNVPRRMRAVIFDLDGVITDTAGLHYAAWKRTADELGVAFDEKKNEQFKGVSRAECLKLLAKWGSLTLSAEEFGELLVRKNEYYKELLCTLTAEHILPGVKRCLASLRERGVPVALFSVSKNTPFILERLGLTDAFDAIVCGNDIQNSKPHFEGYLLAAERLGEDPRLCVMVEDSAAGIRGAKALSMGTLAIMPENTENADLCINGTEELCEALGALLP